MLRHRCPSWIWWRGPKHTGIIGGPTLVVHGPRDFSTGATPTGGGSSVLHHHKNDDAEVQKFSNMSQQWWDIKYNPLIAMNPIRIQFIQQCIQQYLVRHNNDNNHDERNNNTSSSLSSTSTSTSSSSSRQGLSPLNVLDIGCGGGLLCESLVRLGGTVVVGLDPSTPLIQVAQHHAESTLSPLQLSNLQYYNTTVQDYYYHCYNNSIHQSSESRAATTLTSDERFTRDDDHDNHDQKFDVICCLEVLEHVSNEQRRDMLQVACQHLLRPGGLLFVSTINRTLQSYLITIIGAEYIAQILPRQTHDWHQYLSPLTIRDELQSLSTISTTTTTTTAGPMKMVERSVNGMVLPVTSLPATILFHQWDWQLDPNDTNVNWIGCYQKEKVCQ